MIHLLAHQSDWLAMVLVSIPLSGFIALLVLANRRADRDGRVDMTHPEKFELYKRDPERPST